MKVKVSKNLHYIDKTLEEFLLTEFSQSLEEFVPDLSLSCNECHEIENEESQQDSIFSFLLKFKADKLGDPKAIQSGLAGMILPESPNYTFEKTDGDDSFFRSVKNNHYDLKLTEDQLRALAATLYNDSSLHKVYPIEDVRKYLVKNYNRTEWNALLSNPKKRTWKKFLRDALKRQFRSTFCEIEKSELRQMEQTDPQGLRQAITKLNDMECFTGPELNEIRQALGKTFV